MNQRACPHRFSDYERDALVVLGYVHLEQGRAEEAAVLLRPLRRERASDHEVERCLALAELSAGRPEAAAKLAAHAYTHAPEQIRTAMELIYAKALWQTGDESGARDVLLKIVSRQDSSA